MKLSDERVKNYKHLLLKEESTAYLFPPVLTPSIHHHPALYPSLPSRSLLQWLHWKKCGHDLFETRRLNRFTRICNVLDDKHAVYRRSYGYRASIGGRTRSTWDFAYAIEVYTGWVWREMRNGCFGHRYGAGRGSPIRARIHGLWCRIGVLVPFPYSACFNVRRRSLLVPRLHYPQHSRSIRPLWGGIFR